MADSDASMAEPQPAKTQTNRGARLAGALLFLPAVLCCLGTLAGPAWSTLLMSLRDGGLVGPSEFVGLENYVNVLGQPATRSAANFTLLLAVMRAVVVAVVPLLLALGLQGLGPVPRWVVRLAATIPAALYVPALTAAAWLLALHPTQGLLSPADVSWLSSSGGARLVLVMVDAVYVLAVSVALGLVAYLAALRSRESGGRVWVPLLAVWVVSVLAALASALQTLALPLTMTRGGPANSTSTLAFIQYNLSFVFVDFGAGAALGMLVLAVLMALGLVATALIVATRLRLAAGEPATSGRSGQVVLLVIGLLLAAPACLAATAIPAWVGTQAIGAENAAAGLDAISTGRVLANTLLPPVPIVLLQLAVAWIGALGISGLRPLGRSSEWLLLLFAPWLFVTLGPTSLAHFTALREASSLNSFAGLLPPLRFSVPMLFVLALFFKGQAARWQAAPGAMDWGDFARRVAMPSLPLVGLLFVLGWLAGVQEVLWPLLTSQSPEFYTASVAALNVAGTLGANASVMAGLLTSLGLPLFLLFVVLLGALQITLLDRLVITAGDDGQTQV